ncbi:MAG: asparagine synthase C-terminal domain-containing protein [Candidatus Hodarchaeota archaeon]
MKYLENQLKHIISQSNSSHPLGLLYSGGLDSSVIGKIMLSLFPSSSIYAVCVGVPQSYDLINAISKAKQLGVKLYTRFLTEELIMEIIESLKKMKCIHGPSELSIAIPLFLGIQTLAEEFHVHTIFAGQGADELFGGYQKYVKLLNEFGPDIANKAMEIDFQKLNEKQLLIERKISQYFNVNLFYPFLDPSIILFAQSQPVTVHIARNSKRRLIRKVLLRDLAKNLQLSKTITLQPKKAIQYGSGTVKILRKLAKSTGYQNIHDWFQDFFIQD